MSQDFGRALTTGDPKRLLLFGAVAGAGSLGAAAREIGWSQPALSQHMNALEKDLGVTLFDRTPRGIVLTTAGQLALIRATEVAASVAGLRGDLSRAFGLGGRNVRVAGFPSFVIGPLAAALGRLEGDDDATASSSSAESAMLSEGLVDAFSPAPHDSYEVEEAEPPEALALLEAEAIDVAFVFHHEDEEPADTSAFAVHDLGEDHLDLLVPERWNRAGQIRTLADVSDLPWIMGCVRCRSTAERLCRAAGFEPRTRHVTDNPGAIQALVSNGLGVALLPRSARAYAATQGIDSIDVPDIGARRVSAIMLPALAEAPEVTRLIGALKFTGASEQ